jgi:hypothetical protein
MIQIAFVCEYPIRLLRVSIKNAALVGALCLVMVSCGNSVTNESNCDEFYRDGIEFSLALGGGHKRFFFEAGRQDSQIFSVSTTIKKVSDSTKSLTIICKPSFSFNQDNIVTVVPNLSPDFQGDFVLAPTKQSSLANANGSIVKITAKVVGAGTPVQESIWAVVTSEGEPNNGPPGAHPLANFTKLNLIPTIGSLAHDDPVDWFLLKVSPRKSYLITLNTPNLDSSTIEIQGGVYQIKTAKSAIKPRAVNEDSLELIPNAINTIRVNNTNSELVLFVKIEPKDILKLVNQDPVAYELQPVIFSDPPENFPPLAVDDTFANIKIDTANQELDVLKNDNDPENSLSPGTLAITRGPMSGKATATVKDGKILYSPSTGFQGGDVLFYTIRDNFNDISNEAIVLITVK